jgi:hypothetical protein
VKTYSEIFEILVNCLKSCEISWDFEIPYDILPCCGPSGYNPLMTTCIMCNDLYDMLCSIESNLECSKLHYTHVLRNTCKYEKWLLHINSWYASAVMKHKLISRNKNIINEYIYALHVCIAIIYTQ